MDTSARLGPGRPVRGGLHFRQMADKKKKKGKGGKDASIQPVGKPVRAPKKKR